MSDRVAKLQSANRIVSTGDLPALTKEEELRPYSEEEEDSVSVRATKASLLEKMMRRAGSWGKRFAFIGYVNQLLGKRALHESAAIYAAATWYSTYKILYDYQEPYGSRNYISNLAGDDEAIRLLRHKQLTVPWDECKKAFLAEGQTWFSKSITCGLWTVDRNRYTLSLFWGYTIFWRTFGHLVGRNKGGTLYKALFPRGLPEFLLGCGRTSTLMFCFGFVFWNLVGLGAEHKPTPEGLNRIMTTNFVTAAAVIAMVVENTHRWQSLASFMLMSIVD
jgi:hypothetical protein